MNIIIVHGEKPLPSGKIHPEFTNRLILAEKVAKKNKIDLIIITGGKTRKNTRSEAVMGFDYLSNKTQKTHAKIILEKDSKTTYENIIFTKKILKNQKIDHAYIISSKKRIFRMKYLYRLSWPKIFKNAEFLGAEDKYPVFFYLTELFYFVLAIFDRKELVFARFSKLLFRNG
jgi:uncharacterized SAM-binding protein YcdF (DUF218 family)